LIGNLDVTNSKFNFVENLEFANGYKYTGCMYDKKRNGPGKLWNSSVESENARKGLKILKY